MPNITVSIPNELKQEIDSLQEYNWSEMVRQFVSEKAKRLVLLKKLDKMLEHSELSEEDCLRFGEKLKTGMLKRYKAEGW